MIEQSDVVAQIYQAIVDHVGRDDPNRYHKIDEIIWKLKQHNQDLWDRNLTASLVAREEAKRAAMEAERAVMDARVDSLKRTTTGDLQALAISAQDPVTREAAKTNLRRRFEKLGETWVDPTIQAGRPHPPALAMGIVDATYRQPMDRMHPSDASRVSATQPATGDEDLPVTRCPLPEGPIE